MINQIKSNVIHNIKSNEDLSELCLDIAEAYQRIMKRNEKSRKEVEDLLDCSQYFCGAVYWHVRVRI